MKIDEIQNLIAIIFGSSGLLLGILNYIKIHSDSQIKINFYLKLGYVNGPYIFSKIFPINDGINKFIDQVFVKNEIFIGINIVNLSKFTVYIDEVGFCNSKTENDRSKLLINKIIPEQITDPYVINSLQSIDLYNTKGMLNITNMDYKYIYISLSTGKVKYKKVKDLQKTINVIYNKINPTIGST